MKKIKVLFFTDVWNNGGIEKFIENIISNSKNKKIIYEVLTFNKISKSNFSNIAISEVSNKRYNNPIIRYLASLHKFSKEIKKYNFDILHINISNSCGILYAYLAKKAGCKNIIVHAHNSGIDNDPLYLKHILNLICKKILTNNNYRYFGCSDKAVEFCFDIRKINNNFEIIGNGIEYSKFIFNNEIRTKYRSKLGINDNEIVYGNVGRMVPQKNQLFLIDVFKKLSMNKNNIRLIIIGDGKLSNKILKKINNYELNEKIIILKDIKNVNDYLQAMDCFVFPSKYEGLGISLIEAQSADLSCYVSKNVPVTAKIVSDFDFLDIKNNDEWIEKLNEFKNKKRKDNSKILEKSIYNINVSILALEDNYIKIIQR